MDRLVPRDEREQHVDLQATRLGYTVLTFGLLIVVMYRSFANGEAPWDLLGLIVVSGFVSTAYTGWRRAASRRSMLVGAVALIAAAIVSAAVVFFAQR